MLRSWYILYQGIGIIIMWVNIGTIWIKYKTTTIINGIVWLQYNGMITGIEKQKTTYTSTTEENTGRII